MSDYQSLQDKGESGHMVNTVISCCDVTDSTEGNTKNPLVLDFQFPKISSSQGQFLGPSWPVDIACVKKSVSIFDFALANSSLAPGCKAAGSPEIGC